jgi:hypothetical protein
MVRVKTILRRNKDHFPLFVDILPFLQIDLRVNVRLYENLLNRYFGFKLSHMALKINAQKLRFIKDYFGYYSNEGHKLELFAEKAEKFFGIVRKPTAMFYNNAKEMQKCVFLMYQLSYAHYVLGMHYSMKNSFPHYCCGISSGNLLVALWRAGVASAVVANDSRDNHCYVIVPFALNDLKTKGVILIDPTSDQLTRDLAQRVRNNIRIFTSKKWIYKSDWSQGSNLYPSTVQVSACYGDSEVDYDWYVGYAYNNPVIVK